MKRAREGGSKDPTPARLAAAVEAAVVQARRRWTARALEREIAVRESFPRGAVRTAIRRLVDRGILEYQYLFGQSYLVMSFRRPVAVGERFVIIPPGCKDVAWPDRLPLCLAPGSAFGSGRHPTTRLALQGLEKCWTRGWPSAGHAERALRAIDIGTGSGVLAIAAARLGALAVTAVDIDACARSEAAANIALNAAIDRITVTDADLGDLADSFDVVIANLRLPTLVQLLPWVRCHQPQMGCLVVSGIRQNEWGVLKARYAAAGYHPLWYGREAGWVGGLFRASIGEKPRCCVADDGNDLESPRGPSQSHHCILDKTQHMVCIVHR